MRVFLTGATGFIGSKIIPELLKADHEVLGLTRSDAGAEALASMGADAYRGTLEFPAGLIAGVENADAVIHTAFDHDFSNYAANCEKDRKVIETIGAALKGSKRPFLITSAVGFGQPDNGGPAIEDVFNTAQAHPRIASELAANSLLEQGLDMRIMRLPQVHDLYRQGLVSYYIDIIREKAAAPFIGDGSNAWSAGHVTDVAKLYVLALDKGLAGARYNAVAEEGVSMRAIVETVAQGLGITTKSIAREEAQAEFGWFAMMAGADMAASSALTRERLGWTPSGPDLLSDLKSMDYSVFTNRHS
ncbi:SDR family oxidoreductase [Roseibium sp. CAU 1637]|uniref:SDR family oxidoreductase n=1 Tax=Roseibium limicola TaxID=2816037 RepID=A0A939EMH4_9HYPH|nr:SDR family oxidoreductase [Roseibium limicola]MBO0345148.1 SDR family oxidoreductase [Roseibium limicola]